MHSHAGAWERVKFLYIPPLKGVRGMLIVVAKK